MPGTPKIGTSRKTPVCRSGIIITSGECGRASRFDLRWRPIRLIVRGWRGGQFFFRHLTTLCRPSENVINEAQPDCWTLWLSTSSLFIVTGGSSNQEMVQPCTNLEPSGFVSRKIRTPLMHTGLETRRIISTAQARPTSEKAFHLCEDLRPVYMPPQCVGTPRLHNNGSVI